MDLDSNRKLLAVALVGAGSGDRNAIQTVYRLASAKLFAVCLRILGEHSEAEIPVPAVVVLRLCQPLFPVVGSIK